MALIYNSSKTAEATAAEIASTNNVRAAAYQADVTNQTAIEAAVQQVVKDFGKLDILVANSGIVSSIAAEDYTTEQWSEIMKVNLDGAFYSAQAAARVFKQQGHGNVIFTASVSATLVNVPQKQAAVGGISSHQYVDWLTSDNSTMHPRLVLFSWPSACPWNGWTFVASTASRPDSSPPTSSIFIRPSGARNGLT